MLFFRQLATLFGAGIPLNDALACATEGSDGALREAGELATMAVETGHNLSAALGKSPHIFSALPRQLIAVGEMSGSLNLVLESCADYAERSVRNRRKLQTALAYPLIVMGLALTVVVLMVFFVFPQEKLVFESLGGQMPWITQLMIDFFEALINPYTLSLLGLLGLLPFLDRQGVSQWHERLADPLDRLSLRIPVLGGLYHKVLTHRMLLGSSLLIEAGISIADTVQVGELSGNVVVQERYEDFIRRLESGERLSVAASESETYPNLVCQILLGAEEHGDFEQAFRWLVELYEQDLETSLARFSATLEPLVLILMGTGVGFVVLASSLPMLELISQL